MNRRVNSILIAGMKSSGKTTLARMLSYAWHVPFLDLDEMIETEYRADRAVTFREIYRRHGKEHFQELEVSAARRMSRHLLANRSVAALGGGVIDNRAAMEILRPSGVLVYLGEQPDVLYDRMVSRGLPAFLSPDTPRDDFERLYRRRDPMYRTQAEVVVELHGAGTEEALGRLIDSLKEAGYAR